MLTIDIREFKKELHTLIDNASERPGFTVEGFREEVHEIVKRHKMPITAQEYSAQLAKLVMANNRGRAKKLVDCFDDRVLSYSGEAIVALVRLGIKLGLLAVFVVFVVFVYQKCGG